MDFKDRMIEGIERGWWSESEAYDRTRESYLAFGDHERKARIENYECVCNCTCDTNCECKTPVDEGPTGIAAHKSMRYS
jgi:hypothetical protein